MTLDEIRQQLAIFRQPMYASKLELEQMLVRMSASYPYAVTLTLKQNFRIETALGSYYKRLDEYDALKVAETFQQKLNYAVYGNAARRHGKSLRYLPVLEGRHRDGRLHLHYAISQPTHPLSAWQMRTHILSAIDRTLLIDTQRNIQFGDDGWLSYISKDAGHAHTDNVLWQIAS
jgi:hypothetical protein